MSIPLSPCPPQTLDRSADTTANLEVATALIAGFDTLQAQPQALTELHTHHHGPPVTGASKEVVRLAQQGPEPPKGFATSTTTVDSVPEALNATLDTKVRAPQHGPLHQVHRWKTSLLS